LSDDEGVAGSVPRRTVACRSAPLLHRQEARIPEAQDGEHAEQGPADHRDADGKQQHRDVDADLVEAWQLGGCDPSQQHDRRLRQHDANGAAGQCQHNAFR
jgi:hypothetical protein